jgi:hypothetical protein
MKRKEPEHLGLKINRLITYFLLVVCGTCALAAVYFFIKASLE